MYSYSKINTYLTCQKLYYYKYIAKIEPSKYNRTIYQYMSDIMHKVLEYCLENKIKGIQFKSEDNLLYEIMKSNQIDIKTDMKNYDNNKVFLELLETTKNVYKNMDSISYLWKNVKEFYIEKEFTYNEKYLFFIKPDYIYQNDKGTFLYDFKVITRNIKKYISCSNMQTDMTFIRQHDIYKYIWEKVTGKRIDSLNYLFLYKKGENIFMPFKLKMYSNNYFDDVIKLISLIEEKGDNKEKFEYNVQNCLFCNYVDNCDKDILNNKKERL